MKTHKSVTLTLPAETAKELAALTRLRQRELGLARPNKSMVIREAIQKLAATKGASR